MTLRARASSAPPALFALLGLLVIALVSVWIRWPGFTQGGIANHDVAGILYGGMLLDAGKLPYVDSIEMKAPGTFYLASWLAGTDITRFQIWANAWAIASLLAVASLAWRLWGPRAAVMAAAVYGLHDAFLDTMDANYVTWAQLPTVLAALWAVEALRHPGRRRLLLWFVAGMLAGWAGLLKRPNGVVAAGVVMFAAFVPEMFGDFATERSRAQRLRASGAAALGIVVAHLPIALHYAASGHVGDLWTGYVFSARGLAYATYGSSSLASEAWREGPLAAAHFLALPAALAAFALWPPADRSRRGALVFLVVWAALAVAAASIGFRFYKGYFLAALAPLSLLSAAPWGLLGRARGMRRAAQTIALLPALLLVGRQGLLIERERDNRGLAHDVGGRTIARHVAKHSPSGSTVWVWGWHLWDVYPYTRMLSGSRLYKSVSLITTGNDSTWRSPRRPMHFVDGPVAELLLEDLERNRPYFIVLGGSVSVPRREFEGLRRFLRSHYVLDRTIRLGRVQFWKLRDGSGGVAKAGADP